MKLTKTSSAAAALAFAALMGASAHAQNAGDLIIGFEQTGNDNVYEVDLGSASQFLSPSSSTFSFTLSNGDLDTYFGNNWATVTTAATTNAVQWGIIGANTTTGNLTLGSSTLPKNTVLVSWNTWDAAPAEKTTNGEATTVQDINNLYSDVANGGTPTAGSTTALPAIVTSTSDGNSFAASIAASNFNFGAGFTKSPLDNDAAGDFPAADTQALDLYELTPTNATLTQPTTLLGSFTLSDQGNQAVLTYQAAAAPEPATYLLMGLSALATIVLRLRLTSDPVA
jgi:hypothetical protein